MESIQSNKSSVEDFSLPLEDGIMTVNQKKLAVDIMDAGISFVLDLVSIAGNGLSTIVFFKMGYQETINISMTFICAMDFVRCLLSLCHLFHYPFQLISPVLSTTWDSIGRVSLVFSSAAGSFVSIVYAAHVSLERCLCVSMPFTVKHLLTPRVVWINNILITVIVLASFLFFYSCYTFSWVFIPHLNATVAVIGFTSFFFKHPEMSVYMSFMPFSWVVVSFAIICICTAIISYHLRKSSKFKSSVTQQESKAGLSTRDKQVIKMLLIIVTVYMAVMFPRIVFFVARVIFPDFDLIGKERNMFEMFQSLVLALDLVNPATNFFIFYFMSSQFKKHLLEMLCSKPTNKVR